MSNWGCWECWGHNATCHACGGAAWRRRMRAIASLPKWFVSWATKEKSNG